MNKKIQSDFLVAHPSFVSGAARVLDMWGQFDDYNGSETPADADSKAITADWLAIGQDLQDAIEFHESECKVA